MNPLTVLANKPPKWKTRHENFVLTTSFASCQALIFAAVGKIRGFRMASTRDYHWYFLFKSAGDRAVFAPLMKLLTVFAYPVLKGKECFDRQ